MAQNDASATALMERLLAEVTRMRKDVVRLLDRIEPYEDTRTDGMIARAAEYDRLFPIKTNEDICKALGQMRANIDSTEYHLNAIRGRFEEIANDAILREELKPWIKPAAPRERRS